jgi:hypothetical protein
MKLAVTFIVLALGCCSGRSPIRRPSILIEIPKLTTCTGSGASDKAAKIFNMGDKWSEIHNRDFPYQCKCVEFREIYHGGNDDASPLCRLEGRHSLYLWPALPKTRHMSHLIFFLNPP